MAFQGYVERPKFFTEVCGIFSPSLHDPPIGLSKRPESLGSAQHYCPRCASPLARSCDVKRHFPRCIKTNGNPNSLRWFDVVSNNRIATHEHESLKTTSSPSKRKRSGLELASALGDEPGVMVAASKVENWAAMAKKQAEVIYSTSNHVSGADSSPIHNATTITASNTDRSSQLATPPVKKPALTLMIKPKQRVRFATPVSRDEPVTPTSVQQQPRSRERRKLRQPTHNEDTAHLFNNAGFLIPSIPGIDSVTERLFDKGEIMSLRPSGSHDGYYPDGEPRGGSFLLDHSNEKKRKRDDES